MRRSRRYYSLRAANDEPLLAKIEIACPWGGEAVRRARAGVLGA